MAKNIAGDGLRRALRLCMILMFAAAASSAHAERAVRAEKIGERALALMAKLSPGMTYEEVAELLAPAADIHKVGGGDDLVRMAWLHGDFGIEIYFLNEKAYRIDILSNFIGEKAAKLMMDELSKTGRRKTGSNALYDRYRTEYYWDEGDMRISFTKIGNTEVRVSKVRR